MTNIDIEKLDTDNYAVWSVKMKAFLIIKELWSAVTGEGTLRPGSDEKALAQLALHVKDHHLPSLAKASTPQELGKSWSQFTRQRAHHGSCCSSESSTAYARSQVSLSPTMSAGRQACGISCWPPATPWRSQSLSCALWLVYPETLTPSSPSWRSVITNWSWTQCSASCCKQSRD